MLEGKIFLGVTGIPILKIAFVKRKFALAEPVPLTFANLTTEADVEILDQRFKLVARVQERDGNGGAVWDLHADTGLIVPPGVYFYRILSPSADHTNPESGLRKLLLRR